MIKWSKTPPVYVAIAEHYESLQNIIIEISSKYPKGLICNCSGDVAAIIAFFKGMERSRRFTLVGAYEFGKAQGITYVVTPFLTKQIDIEVDGKVVETIKII